MNQIEKLKFLPDVRCALTSINKSRMLRFMRRCESALSFLPREEFEREDCDAGVPPPLYAFPRRRARCSSAVRSCSSNAKRERRSSSLSAVFTHSRNWRRALARGSLLSGAMLRPRNVTATRLTTFRLRVWRRWIVRFELYLFIKIFFLNSSTTFRFPIAGIMVDNRHRKIWQICIYGLHVLNFLKLSYLNL